MPQWTCPSCGKMWDRKKLDCFYCGFSIPNMLGNLSDYQQTKKKKHTIGFQGRVEKVSVINNPNNYNKIFSTTATSGSKSVEGIM